MVLARSLPTPVATLLGRETELGDLTQLLLDGARLVTLTGPPGVGKTRLAIDVAAALTTRFADGVAWVDLAPVREVAVVVHDVVHAAGVGSAAALADRRLLLVIDNCEHLPGCGPELAPLLVEHPGVQILATSRERLRVSAEVEYPVAPLAVPDSDAATDLSALRHNPAVALLLARAPAYVDLTSRTAQPLVEICHRLDGVPLALEFAAARLRVFTPGELAFRLGQRIGELHSTTQDAPTRHRDIRAAIAWSHDLLPESERAVLRRVSVFRGSWTLPAALAVAGGSDVPDVLAAVESLLDKNLIRREDLAASDARFAMLVSIREYAAEQLDAHDERSSIEATHAAWFAAVARDWERTIGTAEENMTWEGSEGIRADLEVALRTVRGRDPEATLWLLSALDWFWYTRGSPAHAADLFPTDAELAASPPDARTAALAAAAAVAFALGDLDRAERLLGEAQELATVDGSDSARRLAFTSAFQGHVDRERGRHEQAAAHYRQTRAVYDRLGNHRGVAWAACDLGLLAADLGDTAAAGELFREALALFESLDYPWAAAVASCGLAAVLLDQGDVAGAATLAARPPSRCTRRSVTCAGPPRAWRCWPTSR